MFFTFEKMNNTEMAGFLKDWVNKYPIISIEDGIVKSDQQGGYSYVSGV